MLILTRRVGESLIMGDDITVTVLGVKANQVHIGVDAPRELPIHREELHRQINIGEGKRSPGVDGINDSNSRC